MLCRSVRELIIVGWQGSGSRCAAPRRAACGAGSRGVRRTVSALRPAAARAPGPDNMGLEKERAESSVIMDAEEFNRSIEPILLRKGKGFSEVPDDRDPNDINAHVKVNICAAADTQPHTHAGLLPQWVDKLRPVPM